MARLARRAAVINAALARRGLMLLIILVVFCAAGCDFVLRPHDVNLKAIEGLDYAVDHRWREL